MHGADYCIKTTIVKQNITMKTTNILIPTDFSLASLTTVTNLLQKQPDQKFNIVLVHFMQLSDSISELLMLSRRATDYQHISTEFDEHLNVLRRQKKDQLLTLGYEFFYGSTVAVFKNYLEAKEIDTIVMLKGHNYQKLTNYSIDPAVLVQKSNYPVIELASHILPMENIRIGKVTSALELQPA